jgi:hypothetical protein
MSQGVVDLIKLFVVNMFTLFESYTFSNHRKIRVTLIQWSIIQKSVSIFTPKSFMRSAQGFIKKLK